MNRRCTHQAHAAFSLIELVIVLAVMGIAAAMAIPRYAGAIARYRVDAAAKRVAADFALASSAARQLGKPVVVSFDVPNSSYKLSGVESLSHRAGGYVVDLTTPPCSATIGTVTFAAQSVSFDLFGNPSASGQVIVNCGSSSKRVVLDQTSGKATVQ